MLFERRELGERGRFDLVEIARAPACRGRSVEVIRPAVIRALDHAAAVTVIFQDSGSAVPAYVQEPAKLFVLAADYDNAVAADIGGHVGAGHRHACLSVLALWGLHDV